MQQFLFGCGWNFGQKTKTTNQKQNKNVWTKNFSIPVILAPLRAGTPNVFFPLKFCCCCCWADDTGIVDVDDDDNEWQTLPVPVLGIGDVGFEYDVVIDDCCCCCCGCCDDDDVNVVVVDDDDGGGGTSDRILSNDPFVFGSQTFNHSLDQKKNRNEKVMIWKRKEWKWKNEKKRKFW